MVKIEEEKNSNSLTAFDLKDGELAIVLSAVADNFIGAVAQKFQDRLVFLGENSHCGGSWENSGLKQIEVKRIKPGTKLVVQ